LTYNTNRSDVSLALNQRKGLEHKSYHTPQEKAIFEVEHTEVFKCKRIDYGFNVQHVLDNRQETPTPKSIHYWATEASWIFGVDIKGDTIRKIIRNGVVVLQAPRPTMDMGGEGCSCMENAILSNINLFQRNGDTEINEATIVAMVENLLKVNTTPNIPLPINLW
jgi:hypothetical protein